ncbi:MAG: hypothetical protein ACK41E_01480 [Deinococcales bacterium]
MLEGLAPWTVQFTELDSDGDPAGFAVQNGVRTEAFAFRLQSGIARFQMVAADKNGSFFCDFDTLQVSGNAFVGGRSARSVRNPNGGGNVFSSLNTSCTAALDSSTGVQPPTLPIDLTPSFPPKPGQKWSLTIDGLAPWALQFTKLDSDGDPTGTGVQNGDSKPVFAYRLQSGTFRFQVFDSRSAVYVCDFPASIRPNGATVSGGAAGFAPNQDANLTSLNKSCSVTLLSSAVLQSSLAPFETMFLAWQTKRLVKLY